MEPGIYHDIPFADYARLPYINSGAVKWGIVTPKHMLAFLQGKLRKDDTGTRKFGRAVHTRLLEPHKWGDLLRAKPCAAILKTGANKGQACGKSASCIHGDNWYCKTSGHAPEGATTPTDFIDMEEAERIEAMAKAVHEHKANTLLKRKGYGEVTVIWDYAGQRLKGRLDRYAPRQDGKPALILDLKKCQVGGGSRDECERAITEYGYFVQMAMYRDAIQRITGDEAACAWMFIEDDEPFDVQVLLADEQTLQAGLFDYKRAVEWYSRCEQQGNFVGYMPTPVLKEGGLTMWKRKEYEVAFQ